MNALDKFARCPHCGKVFATRQLKSEATPTHDYPKFCRSVCPGSGQPLKKSTDTSPLGIEQ